MKRLVFISIVGLGILLIFYLIQNSNRSSPNKEYLQVFRSEIELCKTCPPGFQLNENNQCISRNLYLQYESLENKGVGGLKTALPKVRDGFSPQQIDLGRYLFFDPVLSADGSISCSSCHDPELGFSDGNVVGVGIHRQKLKRASPSLWNVAYLKKLFWDARAGSLEEQMQGPLYAEDEMGTTEDHLLVTLNGIGNYQRLFADAFPKRKPNDSIKLHEIYTSIAAFESSLIF